MPVNYSVPVINSRLTAVNSALNAASSNGLPGVMRLGTASMADTIAIITLSSDAGTVSGGVLTLNSLPRVAPLTYVSGYIVAATLEDGSGNLVASGLTVGLSSAYDIVMASTSTYVSSGQTVAITYGTITGT